MIDACGKNAVIPAHAGIQRLSKSHWMPAFAGMTEDAIGVIQFLKSQ
jgi:hypothetical protein